MNNRFFIMLIVALGLAAGAAWIAKTWVDDIKGHHAEENVVPIVVAAMNISFGTKIDATNLKMMPWPKDHIPQGAFSDTKDVVGKIAQRAFFADEALLDAQVKDKAVGSILSAMIPEGKRAMSVSVTDVSGVAGFITPGNMVDIIATNNKTNKTYILLSNVRVLAIDQLAATEQDKPAVVRSLTLEVTYQESALLVKELQRGPFYFTLRNPIDKKNVAESPTEEELPPFAATEGVANPPPKKPNFKIIDWPSAGRPQMTAAEAKEGVK